MKHYYSAFLLAVAALPALLQEPAPAEAKPQAPAAPQFKAQSTCPISSMALSGAAEEVTLTYEGQKVRLCCAKCVEPFLEFPDKHLWGMMKKGERPENTQTTCVVSGRPLEEGKIHSTWVGNKEIRACSDKCAAKIAADPAPYLDKLEGRKKQEACPVSGKPVDPQVSSVVQGQKVYYCCAGCVAKVSADPAKYFAQMARDKVVTEAAMTTCPVMGEPIETRGAFVTYQGRRVYFCCDKCLGGFFKQPDKYL